MKEIFDAIGSKKKAKQLLKDLKDPDFKVKIEKVLKGLEEDVDESQQPKEMQ